MGTKTEHGTRACYTAGCRCDECRAGKAEDRARREAAKAVEAPPALTSITLAVSCLHCGSPLYLLADGRPTDSGARKVSTFRCSVKKCGRQWLLINVMQSLSGAEYLGAA